MRKNVFLTFLVVLLLFVTACDNAGKVKVYKNTEEVEVTHTEARVTAVVTGMDFENNTISFSKCISGEQYELGYHGGVNVYNIYGDVIDINNISCGSVVDVVYYSDTDRLISISANKDVTTIKSVGKFFADPDNGMAKRGGTSYKLWNYAVAFDMGEPIDIREINTEDQVTLNIYKNELVSVVVELGHGYVRLDNHDTYVGGLVEIGYDVILPVTTDMLIAVREGEYTLRITKNGYSQSKEVKVERDRETYVDLTALAIPTGTVIFNITPADATLYVSGTEQEDHTYTNVYGTYGIRIEAEGYKTFRGNVEIADYTKTYDIKLTSIEDKTEEDSDKTTEKKTTEKTTSEKTTHTTTTDNVSTTEDAQTTEDDSQRTNNVIKIEKPVNVDVYVDGEYVGISPISIPKIIGSHTITLYKRGYIIKSYTIYASDNGKDDEYCFDELESRNSALE